MPRRTCPFAMPGWSGKGSKISCRPVWHRPDVFALVRLLPYLMVDISSRASASSVEQHALPFIPQDEANGRMMLRWQTSGGLRQRHITVSVHVPMKGPNSWLALTDRKANEGLTLDQKRTKC
jgi:hypothetical protein